MKADIQKLRALLNAKCCCASALIEMGLSLTGQENEDTVRAAGALCGGLHKGLLCGALTGGACFIALLSTPNQAPQMISELVEWFRGTYEEAYGGMDCSHILKGRPGAARIICPGIVEATYVRAKEILEDHGYSFT